MNTIKNYYLIIPARNIYIRDKKGNVIVSDGGAAKDIFNTYRIPIELQKIILKVSIGGLNTPKDAFELTTDEMFYFKTPIIEHILGKNKGMLMIASHNTDVYTDSHIYHADKVKAFYQQIIDAGLALDYESAIREIFNKPKRQTDTINDNKVLKKEY